MGDPAQEQQGLNSVFASDSTTIAIIKSENEKLK
jgi:mannan endo-1,4-beta-mannosidase